MYKKYIITLISKIPKLNWLDNSNIKILSILEGFLGALFLLFDEIDKRPL